MQSLAARDATKSRLLLENVQAFNSRSESRSVFFHNPLRNPALLFGTLIAQLIHIGAMYVPWLNDVLGVAPVSLKEWGALLGLALIILVVMEMDKLLWRLISHFRQDRAKPKPRLEKLSLNPPLKIFGLWTNISVSAATA